MKDLAEDDRLGLVDPKVLSLNAVSTQQVSTLKGNPLAQSLYLYIFARYGVRLQLPMTHFFLFRCLSYIFLVFVNFAILWVEFPLARMFCF